MQDHKLNSVKFILIFIVVLFLLSAVTMGILLLNSANTVQVYRNNIYDLKADSYVSELKSGIDNCSTAMRITQLNPTLRNNLFNTDITKDGAVELSSSMGKTISSTTYLLIDQANLIRHAFYSYFPADGKHFFKRSDMELEPWYKGYMEKKDKNGDISQNSNEFRTFFYDSVRSEYQFLLIQTINQFNVSSSALESGAECYEVMRVRIGSFFKVDPQKNDIRAIPYLVNTDSSEIVYSGKKEYEDEVSSAFQDIEENGNEKFLNYTWDRKLESNSIVGVREVPSIGAVLIILFEEVVPNPSVADQSIPFSVIILMALLIMALLLMLLFYMHFSKRIDHLVHAIDYFDENTEVVIPPQKVAGDEIREIERHTVIMQNRIKTLIAEEYKIKIQNISAQYEALSAYINPHFLYNTLNSVSAMAAMEGAEDTKEMILALSDMFKYSADMSKNMVPLEKEIKNIRDYLYIQEIRYGENFVFQMGVDEMFMQCEVPKLILQPIVENCFKHGFIGTSNQLNPNEIIIAATREDTYLKIYILDNGSGIDTENMAHINGILRGERATDTPSEKTEIGLSNVNKRLKLLYGEECGLEISCQKGEYTCVKLLIKYKCTLLDRADLLGPGT